MPPVWTHPVCTDAMTAPVSPPHTNAHIHGRGHTAESDETSAGQRYGHLPQRVKPSSQQTCSSLAEIADSAESLIIAHQGQKILNDTRTTHTGCGRVPTQSVDNGLTAALSTGLRSALHPVYQAHSALRNRPEAGQRRSGVG
jgi:hypothetical protein